MEGGRDAPVATPREKRRKILRSARDDGLPRSPACLDDPQAALEEAEKQVREDGEESGGDGAGEDDGVANHSNAAEDERAESSGANGGGDGGDTDGDDCGGADAGENYRKRKREADAPENLKVGHAHGFGGFEDGRIDAREANVSVAQDGEKRVEDQSDDGGAAADAANEGNGNQETEKREAGNGLQNACDAESDSAQRGALYHDHAERDADENRKGHGDDDEREVLEGGVQDLRAVSNEEGPGGHEDAPGCAATGCMREAVKGRASG